MSIKYIRDHYGVPARRAGRVKCRAWDGWCYGSITSADHRVVVRPDPWPNARLKFHPKDTDNLKYLEDGEKEQ